MAVVVVVSPCRLLGSCVRILVGALWRVWCWWSMRVLSASLPFGYIEPRWGWGCPRWCLAFRLRRRPPRAARVVHATGIYGVSLHCDALQLQQWHTGVMASSRPRATLRPHPRHRWCRHVVWSRMCVAFRLHRWCSVETGSRLTKVVRLLRQCFKLGCPSCYHALRALPL